MTKDDFVDCLDCGRKMSPGNDGCTRETLKIDGEEYDRILVKPPMVCHDCNAAPGTFHHRSCDMERCPACGSQLLGCGHGELIEDPKIPETELFPIDDYVSAMKAALDAFKDTWEATADSELPTKLSFDKWSAEFLDFLDEDDDED